jgi:ribosomal-protein-alanine N-acetyltransferase
MVYLNRLVLKKFTTRYLTDDYVHWLNDPEIVKYSEQRHKTHTLSSCRDYYESFEKKTDLFLAIIVTGSGKHIGNITVTIDVHNKVADIAIMIGEKSTWGKGYGKEAFMGIMNYLFQNSIARKITAGTMSINQPMLAIMDSSGMIADGVKKGQFIIDGKEIDMVMRALWCQQYFYK